MRAKKRSYNLKLRFKLALFHAMRLLVTKIPGLRRLIILLYSSCVGKFNFIGNSETFNVDQKEVISELREKGYYNFGKILDDKSIDEIHRYAKTIKCFDPWVSASDFFSADEAPNGCHVANYCREDLAPSKVIMDIANDPVLLSVVQEYLGGRPLISNINMWWSFPSKNLPQQAQLFHRDVDSVNFIKLFIYLTDVDMDSGPHTYVEGSVNVWKLMKIRRYQDNEVIKAFSKNSIKHFTGCKGSVFLVDTFGVHKGLLPKDKKRLLLQFQYGLDQILAENYNPINLQENRAYNKQVNKLLINSIH